MRDLVVSVKDYFGSYFWDNPIFLKELRLHFRSSHTYWIQGAYLLVIGILLAALTYYVQLSSQAGGRSAMWAIGQTMFRGLFSLHVVLVVVMLSSLASGAITSEREARTYELLESLPLGKGRFVAGKFAALVVLSGMFMASAMPILMVALQIIGGVTSADVVGASMSLLGLVGVTAALGVLASSVSKSYRSALFLCYRIIALALVLSWAVRIYGAVSDPMGAYRASSGMGSAMYALQAFSGSTLFRSMPGLTLILWPISLLLWALPSPTFSLKVSTMALGLCVGAVGPMLTAAAESLRPTHERRPYYLMIQLFVLFHIVLGGFLFSSTLGPVPGAPTTAAAPVPAQDFLMLQAAALFFFSICILPAESKGFDGWRGFFSGGPLQGGLLLSVCVFTSYLLWHLMTPELLKLPGAATAVAALFSIVRAGETLLLMLMPFWAALAFLARKAMPRHPRQAYLGAHLLLGVLPIMLNSLLPPGLKSLNAWLLGLNPWFLMASIDSVVDSGRGQAIARMMNLPALPPGHQVAAFALFLAGCAWAAGYALSRVKKAA